MAVKRATLNNRDTLLFTGAKKAMKSSRGHWVRKVDNIPSLSHYTRTINQLREETLAEIAQGPFSHRLTCIHDSVLSVEKQDDIFILTDMTGKTYKARHVILATGIMEEQPHINGSIDPILPYANKQLVAYCLLCDGHKAYQKDSVMIGHSEAAAKNALLIQNRYEPTSMTILTNGIPTTITEETALQLDKHGITLKHDPIVEIIGDAKARIMTGFRLESGETVTAEVGFVSLGIRPNNTFALALGAEVDDRGLVLTDEHCESTVSNLFVIGDLRANSMKQIFTAWQHAVDAMQEIDRRLRAE